MKYHYLLVKMCVISGRKYLCKKIAKSDAQAIKYTGSGKIVISLKKKYGNSCMQHVSILAKFPEDQLEEFSETCKSYSKQFNVVESVDSRSRQAPKLARRVGVAPTQQDLESRSPLRDMPPL